MIKKIINFLKNNGFLTLSILFLLIACVFVITGICLEIPYLNLEQEYQIEQFGFYDSSKTYLLDVKNTLYAYSGLVIVGLSFAGISAVSLVLGFIDFYTGKKHEKENN